MWLEDKAIQFQLLKSNTYTNIQQTFQHKISNWQADNFAVEKGKADKDYRMDEFLC